MKLVLKGLVAVLIVSLAAHVWMNWPVRLDTAGVQAGVLPATGASKVKVTILETGYLESPHAMNVRGGAWEDYRSGVMAVLLEHPNGKWLLDAGFGKNALEHYQSTTPLIMQAAAKLTITSDIHTQLREVGVAPSELSAVLLTHAHWDHVSGLEDLLDVPLLLNADELEFINSGSDHAVLAARWADQYQLSEYRFDGAPMAGFPASHDLVGDGSIILLPMAGHTPGSAAVLVNGEAEQWLFVGDTSWTQEGIQWPAEKPFVAKSLVETDAEQVAYWLKFLHQLKKQNPALKIVPAHDRRAY